MPRAYHSVSSVELGRRCQHAWALTYIDGLREPSIDWADIESGRLAVAPRQRASALGQATHAVGEAYMLGRRPAWSSLPGQIYQSGVHLVPHPKRVEWLKVEQPIGSEPLPAGLGEHAPPVGMRVHDVMWAGYKDLVFQASPGESARLGLPRAPVLVDYKTTADIVRWALTPDSLRVNAQANLYAIDVCERFNLDSVHARWLYLETKRVRRAYAVDTVIDRQRAYGVIAPLAVLARELDTLESSAAALKNPAACADYGGCRFHKSAGGPCDARRSIGALIQARVRKDKTMAIDPKIKARFAKQKAEIEAPDDVSPESDDVSPEAESSDAPTEAPAPKQRAPRARAPKADTAESIMAAIADAKAKRDACTAELSELVGKLQAALA